MTNEEAEKILFYHRSTGNLSPMLNEALDLAISGLSKQSASGKQVEDVPDTRVGKTDFKPGDKFILELGAERRMLGDFEIKGTDLYVKTDLLEKLKRYELEEKPEVKSEIICDPDCDGFVCSQNGIYGWCPKMERWGCEYFYELERRNDG